MSSAAPHPSLQRFLESADFTSRALSIVVVGASGHLARTQVIPAIFSLYCKRLLPRRFSLVGYARSEMDDAEFRGDKLSAGLRGHESHELHNMQELKDQHGNDERKERSLVKEMLSMVGLSASGSGGDAQLQRVSESDRSLRRSFLSRCFYVQGKYDQPGDYARLVKRLEEVEAQPADGEQETGGQAARVDGVNRVFYLAIPPTSFSPALDCISGIRGDSGWTRIVVEKPFGEDLQSAKELNSLVQRRFSEQEIFRIDHFMGKETLLNLLPLRFSNALYAAVWSRQHVQAIVVNVKESFGLEGRAGYFDQSGIVRDMVQNHLLSITALLTMEEPTSTQDDALHKAKTELYKSMKAVLQDDIVLGQYAKSADGKKVGYAEEEDVKQPSRTATYVAVVLHIDSERWRGVPVLLHCGKALDETKSELLVHFKPGSGSSLFASPPANALRIRLAPKASIAQRVNLKSPGLSDEVQPAELELLSEDAAHLQAVPTAYERLVFDVIRGDRRLFVSAEEVEAAWQVVDPVLRQLESAASQPALYQFGSHGPAKANALLAKYNIGQTIEEL